MANPASMLTRIVSGAAGIGLFFAAGAVVWNSWADTGVADLYPPLNKIMAAISDPGIWSEGRTTLGILIVAFAKAVLYGLALGAAAGVFPAFRAFAYPVIRLLALAPFVALIPVFMLWYGLASEPAGALAMLSMAISIAAGTANAFTHENKPAGVVAVEASIPQRIADAVQDAPPQIFASLRAALRLGAMLVLAYEIVLAKSGIGALLMMSTMSLDPPKTLAIVAVIWLGLVALDLVLLGAEWGVAYVRGT